MNFNDNVTLKVRASMILVGFFAEVFISCILIFSGSLKTLLGRLLIY